MKPILMAMAVSVAFAGGARSEDIKIGIVGGQTGALAIFDQPLLLGAQLAAKKINEAGGIDGKKIEILARDSRSDTTEAVVAAQELVGEGINILVAPSDGDPTIAAGQVGQAADILTISACATPPILPAAVGDRLYLNCVPDNVQAAVLGKYAVKTGYKTAALLISRDSVYTEKLPQYFGEVFEKNGGKVTATIEYKMNQQDFGVEISKIKAMDPRPDVIMTSAYEPDFPAFVQQLRAQGITIPIIGSDGIDTGTVASLGAPAEGVVFSTAGYPTPGSPLAAFQAAYEKEYGNPTDTVFSAFGYDLMQVIKAAVENADGKLDTASLIAGMEKIDHLQVSTGTTTYKDMNRIPLRTVSLLKIVSGQRTHVEDSTPELKDIPTP